MLLECERRVEVPRSDVLRPSAHLLCRKKDEPERGAPSGRGARAAADRELKTASAALQERSTMSGLPQWPTSLAWFEKYLVSGVALGTDGGVDW